MCVYVCVCVCVCVCACVRARVHACACVLRSDLLPRALSFDCVIFLLCFFAIAGVSQPFFHTVATIFCEFWLPRLITVLRDQPHAILIELF